MNVNIYIYILICMSNIPTLLSDRRNYTFLDGVCVAMFVFAMLILNLVLTLLETWTSHTMGYGLVLALLLVTISMFHWKASLDDDTFTDNTDYIMANEITTAVGLFIVSEIFIFFGFFWAVIYSLLTDFTIDSVVTGYVYPTSLSIHSGSSTH